MERPRDENDEAEDDAEDDALGELNDVADDDNGEEGERDDD